MLTLTPKIPVPERILCFGAAGSGKSNNVLQIMRKLPNKKFYIVDNDLAYYRMMAEEYPDVLERGNYQLYEVDSGDWVAQLEAAEAASRACGEGDWYVFDMVTETWEACQAWYSEQIYSKDIADFFLDKRLELEHRREEGRAALAAGAKDAKIPGNIVVFDQLTDWGYINKQYKKLYRTFLDVNHKKAHLYVTAEATKVNQGADDQDTITEFGPYLFKPKGQKRMRHLFHTVILMKHPSKDKWTGTSIGKDRGRPTFVDKPITDFATDYLVGVAGWKPGVVPDA